LASKKNWADNSCQSALIFPPPDLNVNADQQKQTESTSRRLRIWNRIFVYAQTIVVILLVISWVQSSRGNKYLDIEGHPIAGTIVIVLFLVTPLFLVIATPFFWNRFASSVTGFIAGLMGLLYVLAPVY